MATDWLIYMFIIVYLSTTIQHRNPNPWPLSTSPVGLTSTEMTVSSKSRNHQLIKLIGQGGGQCLHTCFCLLVEECKIAERIEQAKHIGLLQSGKFKSCLRTHIDLGLTSSLLSHSLAEHLRIRQDTFCDYS